MKRSWQRPALLCATVLAHAGALLLFLAPHEPGREKGSAAAMDLVWVIPAPPKPLPAPDPEPEKAALPRKDAQKARRQRLTSAPQHAPAAQTELVAVPAEPAALPGQGAPFDHEGALKTARAIAREVDPVLPGTRYTLTRDEKLGRAIAGAKRSDCIGPNAHGNLLTPLSWLLQKKGSGCKF